MGRPSASTRWGETKRATGRETEKRRRERETDRQTAGIGSRTDIQTNQWTNIYIPILWLPWPHNPDIDLQSRHNLPNDEVQTLNPPETFLLFSCPACRTNCNSSPCVLSARRNDTWRQQNRWRASVCVSPTSPTSSSTDSQREQSTKGLVSEWLTAPHYCWNNQE